MPQAVAANITPPPPSATCAALHDALAECLDAMGRLDGAGAALSCLSEIGTGRDDDLAAAIFTMRAVGEAADRVRSAMRRAEDYLRLARGEIVA